MMQNTEASLNENQQQLLKGFMSCIKNNIYTNEEVVKKSWANIQDKPIDINTLSDFQIDEKDPLAYQCNPLHVAVSVNNSAAVTALLELGANPNCADSKDRRGRYVPLRIALDKGHFEIASILIEHGASPNSRSMYGSGQQMTLIDRKTKQDLNRKYGSECVTNEEQLHPTLLRYYVESNKEEQAIFLIENDADLNPPIPLATIRVMMSGTKSQQDVNEDFLKTYAKENCPSLILEAYQKQMYKVVQAMLEKNRTLVNDKYPSQHRSAGNTMLHRATIENNLTMVETLLRFGANPNEVNKEKQTPLTLVASRKNFDANTLQIARLLILQSALQNPNINEKLPPHTNPPNKTLVSKINKMLYITACLQSAFRYAANIDKKLDTYSVDKGNILQALINSKLNWLGNIAAINSKQDSDEINRARVSCINAFKEIIQQLDDIYRIFDGTQRDDPFLFTKLVKDFLSKNEGNSIGHQFLIHKIQNRYPKNKYPELYPELQDSQKDEQKPQAPEGTDGSSSTVTDLQPLPKAPQDKGTTSTANNGEQPKGPEQIVSTGNEEPLPPPSQTTTSTSTLTGGAQQPEEPMEPSVPPLTDSETFQPNIPTVVTPPSPPLSDGPPSTPQQGPILTSIEDVQQLPQQPVSTGHESSQPTAPVPPSPLPLRTTSTSKSTINVLEQIQALKNKPMQLRHVETDDQKKTDNRNGRHEDSLEFTLGAALDKRRKSMKSGEKKDIQQNEGDNKEWSDDEGKGNSPSPRPSP